MNRIVHISEKPTYTYFSNAGFYIFSKRLTHIIPKNTFFNATDFVEELIKKEHVVTSFEIFGYWNDIGSIEDYEKSNNDILSLNLFQ
jgi:NDP-sugar pyrophosphorylase family protein